MRYLGSFGAEVEHFLGDPDVLHGIALILGTVLGAKNTKTLQNKFKILWRTGIGAIACGRRLEFSFFAFPKRFREKLIQTEASKHARCSGIHQPGLMGRPYCAGRSSWLQ